MKMGRNYSPLKFAKSLGFTGRTKFDALVWLIEEKGVDPRKMRGVMRVLEKASLVVEVVAQ